MQFGMDRSSSPMINKGKVVINSRSDNLGSDSLKNADNSKSCNIKSVQTQMKMMICCVNSN